MKEKHRAFKAWKAGTGTRAAYDTAKQTTRRAVHHAREEAEKGMFENIDPHSPDIFRLANQLRRHDVVGEKPVKNDAGELSMSDADKQKQWLEHYERLLNIEFDWDPEHLSEEPPYEGPPFPSPLIW